MILVLDNYDSFVHNLARQFRLLGQTTTVLRNDATTVAGVLSLRPQAIVISPGPCGPQQAGIALELIRAVAGQLPLLGVCLGHQAICEAFGASVVPSGAPVHGRSSLISHCGSGLFAGLPDPMRVGRYHSLIVESQGLPQELQVTATTGDGTVMAVQHREYCLAGVQFHPESLLTEQGPALLANFLRMAGIGETLPGVEQNSAVQTTGAGVSRPAGQETRQ